MTEPTTDYYTDLCDLIYNLQVYLICSGREHEDTNGMQHVVACVQYIYKEKPEIEATVIERLRTTSTKF